MRLHKHSMIKIPQHSSLYLESVCPRSSTQSDISLLVAPISNTSACCLTPSEAPAVQTHASMTAVCNTAGTSISMTQGSPQMYQMSTSEHII